MNYWLRFSLKRLAGLVTVFFAASFLVFSLLYLAPGSPISFLLGKRPGTPEQIAAIKAQYHLDDPFFVRYTSWLGDVLSGDFGQSIVYRQDVADLIGARAATTASLVGYAALIILLAGFAWGLLAALRPGAVDGLLRSGMTLALSTPPFVVGVVLILVFALALGWFPAFGTGRGFLDAIWHLTLPAVALSAGGAAFLARITRAAAHTELGREHVETARARGLADGLVIRRHVVRNALIPVVTVAGLTVASLVAGAVVVESVFAVDGLGSLLVRAILQRDFVVVQALVLLLVLTFIVINTLVDVIYTLVDPRIKA